MKIRNGVEKLGGIKVSEHHLEISKCLTRTAHDVQIIAGVKGNGGHIVAQTPEAIFIHQIILTGAKMVEVQALGFWMFGADMLSDAVNILHQLDGMLESIGVHALHQIGLDLGHPSAVIADVINLIGMVDIAHLDLIIREKWARNAKSFAYLQELTSNILIHGHIIHACFSHLCIFIRALIR